ncbi:MAG: hypothetical protein ACR2OU_16660 [Thermomicrobiales bacterium]
MAHDIPDQYTGPFDMHLTRRAALRGLGAAGLAAVFVARGTPFVGAQADTYPKLAITAKDYEFQLPATVPGGYTEITLKNEGPDTHHAMFMRLNEGKTLDDFMAAAKLPNFGALFAVSTSQGGPASIDAGQESSVILNLQTGQYVVICVIPGPDGMPHYQMGMLAPITVTEVLTAGTEPTAETTVDLVDFSFENLPKELPAGKHTWKVTDTGKQVHELSINRLAPGVTFDQVKAMLMAPLPASPVPGAVATPQATPVMSGPPPFVAMAGVAPMSPGETNWALIDVTAGDYFAICFVPDTKTGAPHFMLGMIMPFTVK